MKKLWILLGTSIVLIFGIGWQQTTVQASTVWHNETPKVLRGIWQKTIPSKYLKDKHEKIVRHQAYRITKRFVSYAATGLDDYGYKVSQTAKVGSTYYVRGYMQDGSTKYYRTFKFIPISVKKMSAPVIMGSGQGVFYKVRHTNAGI
ncbi:hypothetical protein OF387_01920 [Lentilactobacillus hilgardii]|nr:hypothetical protein [Lentilactobacillus hilgardii]MCV3739973.1 hypothetical protein [Lentilactobacillus hilgardii]